MTTVVRAAALACVLIAQTAVAEEITLREAVAEALSRHPSLVAANAARDEAAGRLAEAHAGWLPRAEASAVSTRSNNPVFVFGSLLEQGRFAQQHFDPAFLNDPPALRNDRLSVTIRYALFDQFRRLDSMLQARNGVAQASGGVDEASQRLRLDVMSRFFALGLAHERLEVTRESVKASEAQAAAIREKLAEGLVVESDLLSTEVQLASDRQQTIAAEGDLAIARSALAIALQRPISADLSTASLTLETALPEIELESAIARGLERRGEMRGARLSRSNADLQIRTARGALLPRIDLYANWGASGSTFRHRNSDSTAGAVVSVDLFDGGKFARVTQARAAAAAAQAATDLTRDRIRMEIIAAYHHTHSARERVAVAARASEQAGAAAEMIRDRYENGLTTITEHLRAQAALLRARLDLLAARYDYFTGYAELLRSTGGLNDVDLFS